MSIDPQIADKEELEEINHFQKILYNIKRYEYFALTRLKKYICQYAALSKEHQSLIPNYLKRVERIRDCIRQNQQFLNIICPESREVIECDHSLTEMDIDHTRSTLRQFVRDWSIEGQIERDSCYTPILKQLDQIFPHKIDRNRNQYQILIPGAGLGRLAYEVAKLGFSCQGNEFSLYMLFASQFILNQTNCKNHFTIFPYVLNSSNVVLDEDICKPIHIPDECPSDMIHILEKVDFSMIGGDFLLVYTQPDQWDCIITCFFIDTAHNIFAYLERIYRILRPGGYWINIGPLLYHFENTCHDSIEISLEEVLSASEKIGFQFMEANDTLSVLSSKYGVKFINSTYANNSNSMMHHVYQSAFFTAQKPTINHS